MFQTLGDEQLDQVSGGQPMTERPPQDKEFRQPKKGPITPPPADDKPVRDDEPRQIPSQKF